MKRRYTKLNDFQVLNILPEPSAPGVRIQVVEEFFRKRGVEISDTTVYSRLRTLYIKGFVDIYREHTHDRSYRQNPVLHRLTLKGVSELNRLRREYRQEYGEEAPRLVLESGPNETGSRVDGGGASLVDFLSKYKGSI